MTNQIFRFYKRTCLCGCGIWIPFWRKGRIEVNRYYEKNHIGFSRSGVKQSPEHIQNWLTSRKGYRHSQKIKQRIADSMLKTWDNKRKSLL